MTRSADDSARIIQIATYMKTFKDMCALIYNRPQGQLYWTPYHSIFYFNELKWLYIIQLNNNKQQKNIEVIISAFSHTYLLIYSKS